MESPDSKKRNKAIAAAMATEVMEDMTEHLLPRKLPWKRDGWAWSIIYHGQEVRSRMEYILGTDLRLFQICPSGTPDTTSTTTWSWGSSTE